MLPRPPRERLMRLSSAVYRLAAGLTRLSACAPPGWEYSTGTAESTQRVSNMSSTWQLRSGKVKVVEDASTASLVVIARDLKDRDEKVAVLEEIVRKMKT
jgi:hypothetical protein